MLNINAGVKRVFALWMLLVVFSASLNLYAAEPVKIITYTDYPPYLYHVDGQQAGLYLHIVDVTLKAIDQPYTVVTLPFKRGLYQAAAGDGMLIGIMKTDERLKTLDFSEPFYQERISVFFNEPKVPLITSVDELDGLTIGKLLGWSYGPEFDRAKEQKRFFTKNNELESNFYILSKGRLDAVVHTELSAAYVLNKLALEKEVYLGSEPLSLGNIYLAVKKGTQQNLLNRINRKLNEPEHRETIDLLIKSYTE